MIKSIMINLTITLAALLTAQTVFAGLETDTYTVTFPGETALGELSPNEYDVFIYNTSNVDFVNVVTAIKNDNDNEESYFFTPCGTKIRAGGYCRIRLQFKPAKPGNRVENLVVSGIEDPAVVGTEVVNADSVSIKIKAKAYKPKN